MRSGRTRVRNLAEIPIQEVFRRPGANVAADRQRNWSARREPGSRSSLCEHSQTFCVRNREIFAEFRFVFPGRDRNHDSAPLHVISSRLRRADRNTHHMPNDTSNFPASYTPPLPKVFTSVDIISVTVLILRALRALQDANLVPQPDHLEPEMRKKQILSKYFVSLACQDNLSSWRNLLRPTSLPPILTPRPLSSLPGTIHRLFKTANVTPRTCSSNDGASKTQKDSSDPPDVSDRVLVLGLGNLGTNLSQSCRGTGRTRSSRYWTKRSTSSERVAQQHRRRLQHSRCRQPQCIYRQQ